MVEDKLTEQFQIKTKLNEANKINNHLTITTKTKDLNSLESWERDGKKFNKSCNNSNFSS